MTLKVHDIVANGYGLMEQAHSVTVLMYVWCMLYQKRIHFTSHTRGVVTEGTGARGAGGRAPGSSGVTVR